MKIAVYGTARNESSNLNAWLDSTAGADYVAVNDTGSSDDTYALLQADARVHGSQLPVEPMLLCNALNIALNQLPDDIDLAIRLDLDERLQPGWRDELERVVVNGPTVIQPWFDHHGITYRHDRVHSRHGFRWELPVHEVLTTDGPYSRVPVEFTIEHHQDLTRDRSIVLQELIDTHEADPTNLRILHYLAREYTYYQRWTEAIPLLYEHATSDAFPEERSESWRLLGDAYVAVLPLEHVNWEPYRQATEVCRHRREGWVAAADLHHLQGNWRTCLYMARRALSITEKSWYFNHPFAWGGKPWHLAALACWHIDEFAGAAHYGRQAVELEPDNDLYRSNLAFYEGAACTSVPEPLSSSC